MCNKNLVMLLVSVSMLSFGACSTVGDVLYGQKEVDASGPAPEWVLSPDKTRRVALAAAQHIFIGKSDGADMSGLKDKACGDAVQQAEQSGFTLKNPDGQVYWNRTRGEIGDRFHYFCEIEVEGSK